MSSDRDAPTAVLGPGQDIPMPSPIRAGLPTIDPRNYKIGEDIAEGGMGRIRAAVDLRLGRDVALKELLVPDEALAARFERESLVTARLQHPSIVAVYEAGRWPTGEPFLAMKLVRGTSLKEAISDAKTFDARVALLPHAIAVCDAIAFAHGQRIIHRDLKPANVLVGELGETVVIDWGLAKDLSSPDDAEPVPTRMSTDASLTSVGSIMGTPNYMPPEQARGEPVDERADVYALGAILYYLLGSAPPYDGADSAVVIAMVTLEPPKPLVEHAPRIAPDLLAIVERAMAREPADRYPTARQLAEDLRRFQTGQLVASHNYTRAQLVRRFIARNRVTLGIVTVAAIALGVSSVVSVRKIQDQRDHAELARAKAAQESAAAVARMDELLVEKAAVALDRHDPTAALTALTALSPGTKQLQRARVVAAEAFAEHVPHVLHDIGDDVQSIALSPDGKQLAIANANAVRLMDLSTHAVRELGAGPVERVSFSPDGKWLASASNTGTITLRDTASAHTLQLAHPQPVVQVRFGAGRLVSSTMDSTIRIWDLSTGKVEQELAGARAFEIVGDKLIWVDDAAHVVDLVTHKARAIPVGPANGTTVAPDGTQVALGLADGTVAIVELGDGSTRVLGKHGSDPVYTLVFSPDSARLATLGADHEVRLWPVSGGAPQIFTGVASEGGGRLLFAPDGRALIASGTPPRMWDLDTGTSIMLATSSTHHVFAPDGKHVVALVGQDLWTWPVRPDARLIAKFDGVAHQVAYLADGRALAASDDRLVVDGQEPLSLPTRLVGRMALTRDRKRAAMLGADGIVRTIDLATHAIQPLVGTLAATARSRPQDGSNILVRRTARIGRDHNGWFELLAFSPDGATLAGAGTYGGTLRIWTLANNASKELDLGADVEQIAFSPDGRTVLAGCGDGRIHAITDGVDKPLSKGDPIEAIAAAEGVVATGGVDHKIRLWDLATGVARELAPHHDVATILAMSPDGRWLASGTQDKTVRLDDLQAGKTLSIDGHTGPVLAIALSPGGGLVASTDGQGTVRLYDVAAQRGRTLARRGAAVGDVAISPDGKRIAVAGEDGLVREWTDDVPADEASLRAWIAKQLAD